MKSHFHVPFLSICSVSSVSFSPQSPPPSSTPLPDLVTEDESPGQHTVEVAIPNVGTFVIESQEGGYDDEVALAQSNLSLFYAEKFVLIHIWRERFVACSHCSKYDFHT